MTNDTKFEVFNKETNDKVVEILQMTEKDIHQGSIVDEDYDLYPIWYLQGGVWVRGRKREGTIIDSRTLLNTDHTELSDSSSNTQTLKQIIDEHGIGCKVDYVGGGCSTVRLREGNDVVISSGEGLEVVDADAAFYLHVPTYEYRWVIQISEKSELKISNQYYTEDQMLNSGYAVYEKIEASKREKKFK